MENDAPVALTYIVGIEMGNEFYERWIKYCEKCLMNKECSEEEYEQMILFLSPDVKIHYVKSVGNV